MAIFDVSNEIGWLTFRNFELYRIARSGGNDKIPTRGDNNARFHFRDHIASIGRDRPDGADLLQSLCPGWRLGVMKEGKP